MEHFKCPKCGWDFMSNKFHKLYCPRCRNLVVSFKSGGCFIATAVYGNAMADEVMTLKRFRDKTSHIKFFKCLFNYYYTYSPKLSESLAHKHSVKYIIKIIFLDPVVKILRVLGY